MKKLMTRRTTIIQCPVRGVNMGFGKPVIGFGKPVLNRLSVSLTFIKI